MLDQEDASTASTPASRIRRRVRLSVAGTGGGPPVPTAHDVATNAAHARFDATAPVGPVRSEVGSATVAHPEHTPAVLGRRAPVEPPGRLGLAAKRAIDIAGGSACLVFLGPFLLGVAVLIALVDGRPVLFRQERAGRGGRAFLIYKYRTMRNGADAERAVLRARNEVTGGASFKMTNDPRVTRLGRLLRRASVDEFPQLLNVLRGEMSMVGPRPHPFDDLAGYESWHHARLVVKPGITGLWQVSSRRDPNFDRWVELDLEYIRSWSPMLDIKIMARTIPAMVRGEGR